MQLVVGPRRNPVLLRILVKSTKRAKSTVAGVVEEISVTGVPPPCGTRLALVICTINDSTSQMGASVPKATADPDGVGETDCVMVLGPAFDPHPTTRAPTKTNSPPNKNSVGLLFILSS